MEEISYWIWISKIKSLGSVKIQKLLEIYKEPKKIFELKKQNLLKLQWLTEKNINEILDIRYRKNLEKEKNKLKKQNVSLITIKDTEYPINLQQIYDKPICLYVKGNKENLNQFSLGMIGCRENSSYGKQVAETIAKSLVKNNIITISGLAKGIDSISHKATILANGKTIAVIGSGLDFIYPYENINLANEIIKRGGTIISEYPLGTKPSKLNFPARNRIISGISSGIIVIEAKKKSGTMITVDFALEQGKNVFTVPRKYNKYKFRRNK